MEILPAKICTLVDVELENEVCYLVGLYYSVQRSLHYAIDNRSPQVTK